MLLRRFVKQFSKGDKKGISVSTGFILLSAAALLIVPLNWLCAWLLALVIHELCHYVCIRICGGNVSSLRLGLRGIVMETEPLSLGREAVCAYAGPIGALSVLLIAKYLPRTAICTIVLSGYNLLPIFPLDGGRGLGCLLHKYFPEHKAQCIQRYIEYGVILSVAIVAVYAVTRLGLGIMPAVIAACLFVRSKGIKFPCKICRLGLQ